jgi:hypothetical protein
MIIKKGHRAVIEYFMSLGCTEKVKNIHGQKALYWISAKCPDLVI